MATAKQIERLVSAKAQQLAAQIDTLAPADKLRLAALAIEHRQYGLAETLAERVALELQALRILGPGRL